MQKLNYTNSIETFSKTHIFRINTLNTKCSSPIPSTSCSLLYTFDVFGTYGIKNRKLIDSHVLPRSLQFNMLSLLRTYLLANVYFSKLLEKIKE